jgi:cobalt-zinc-cadmium efflux system protein
MHQHGLNESTKERPLLISLVLTSGVCIAELAGGLATKSLALMSDAAHMLTDVTALLVAIIAIRVGRRAADTLRTFGYHRFEIIAATFNTLMLFAVAIYILYEAYHRIGHPSPIQTLGMLIIACIGLAANFSSILLLHSHKDSSLNIKGAYLEVWADMLGSLGVIIAAIVIKLTGWLWFDSAIAIIIALWVLPRAWLLLKESMNVLLEGIPKGIDLALIEKSLLEVEGVVNVHELHVWAIGTGKNCLTAHVVLNETSNSETLLPQLRERLAKRFNIYHSTLQPERTKCLDEEVICHFSEGKE